MVSKLVSIQKLQSTPPDNIDISLDQTPWSLASYLIYIYENKHRLDKNYFLI